jgi:23S rRNA (cytidine1920-2'-O)/16S rRNA (cytidine1409-2'-O)-methyltransferase
MRLDISLVNKGLAQTREKARFLIESGFVKINGQIIKKRSYNFKEGEIIEITDKLPYVSRAGLKIKAALDEFKINVKDLVCLDIGSSTGGFTDCLLQEGAKKVYAVDVGTDQLDKSLRNNNKVEFYEGVDIRKFDKNLIKEPLDLIVIDVSFISIKFIVEILAGFTNKKTEIISLIKPQFEVGKEYLKKGIVIDMQKAAEKIEEIKSTFKENGFEIKGEIKCPVKGKEGNQEYLLYVGSGKNLEK